MSTEDTRCPRASQTLRWLVALAAAGLLGPMTAGCGGLSQDDCESLELGSSRAAVADEIGDADWCAAELGGQQQCRVDEDDCDDPDDEQCSCFVIFDVEHDILVRSYWSCGSCAPVAPS